MNDVLLNQWGDLAGAFAMSNYGLRC